MVLALSSRILAMHLYRHNCLLFLHQATAIQGPRSRTLDTPRAGARRLPDIGITMLVLIEEDNILVLGVVGY